MKKTIKKKIKIILLKKNILYKKLKLLYKKIKTYKINKNIKNYKKKLREIKNLLYFFILKKKKLEEVIIEIKSGVGGDESSMFILDLYKMYIKFFKKNKWKIKILSINFTKLGGIKDIIINLKGIYIYSKIKFESGVHRIQRNPINDKRKIHTSTCKIAILKKYNLNKIKLKKNDLIFKYFKSSGPGGQSVNNTNSAVRIIHIPTKLKVECQDERNQHSNKKKAIKNLHFKLFVKNINDQKLKKNSIKKNLVGIGNRSEKIRTYNYVKNKIIEHRIKFIIDLNIVMQGNLNLILNNFKNFVQK